MCMLDIEVFDNTISEDSNSSLHKIQLSGFKLNFLGFDESKYHNPALLYDKKWKDITIRFKLRDVFRGTAEYSFVRIINNIPFNLMPKNDFIISKMKFIPFKTPDIRAGLQMRMPDGRALGSPLLDLHSFISHGCRLQLTSPEDILC
ncbi:hypothetical protein RF11_06503 [Thelohanellus kitauei]|uniref:Uncharacterized protein n=1 Tax=Thelohanellus kitauei TaxID=669202 RepID=A0A0C2NFQ9_THEKT|nr:hypothetical protein RF11_06503 [Thelohanellus kitauei]